MGYYKPINLIICTQYKTAQTMSMIVRSYRTPISRGDMLSGLIYLGYSPGTSDRQRGVFKCKCGNIFTTHLSEVKRGKAKSCGCVGRQKTRERSLKHGSALSGKVTPEYKAWISMKIRCHKPGSANYKNYGAKGIFVCERWLKSFDNFLEDMGRRPSDKHSIDRINVYGNYEPSNCRWATMKEQGNNRSNNNLFTYKGETKSITLWAERYNMSTTLIKIRMKQGLTFEQALLKPKTQHNGKSSI